jgi:thioredoxin-like negative regulator of GroEL
MRAAAVALLCLAPLAGAAAGPFRALSLEQALAAGRAERKPVLVELTAEWCSSCKELELKTLSRGRVQRFLEKRFVAIQVDGEKGEGPALRKRFHVVGYPTVLVLDANGREIDRLFDVSDPEPFVSALEGFLRGAGTTGDLERRLAARPDDLQLRFDLGTRLALRGERERAVILLADVVNADLHNARGLASRALLTMGKFLFLRGQNEPETARRLLEALVRAYPRSPEVGAAVGALARALWRLGARDGAIALLEDAIRRDPRSGSGYNRLAWFHFQETADLEQALRVAERGLSVAPRDDSLWDSYAEFLSRANRREEARAAAEKALKLKPGDPYYRYQARRFGLAAQLTTR